MRDEKPGIKQPGIVNQAFLPHPSSLWELEDLPNSDVIQLTLLSHVSLEV